MKLKSVGIVCIALAGVIGIAASVRGQDKKEMAPMHKIVHSGDLKWTPIFKGCDLAVVEGNPDADGTPFVIRLHCQEGSKIPAHWHPTDENVTVLKGTFQVGLGEKFDEAKLMTMNPGNFLVAEKEMRHFAFSKTETVVQVHGVGPFKVNWVNPADVQPPDAPTKK